jgi:hypothetical protein
LQTIEQFKARLRLPYSMRHVPIDQFNHLIDVREFPICGDIVLASVEKIAKNSAIELDNGRRSSLHEGDIIAAVFGNRYATLQFEGLAQRNGDFCDLLSMGGLCGIVQSKHAKVAEPTKLRLLGAISDSNNHPLCLRNYRVQHTEATSRPHMIVVCGSSMDAGKTYTAMSIIKGLEQSGKTVAGIKLTGTATGKDTWNMLDGGACVALDFVDGGFPSTSCCNLSTSWWDSPRQIQPNMWSSKLPMVFCSGRRRCSCKALYSLVKSIPGCSQVAIRCQLNQAFA